MDRWLRNQNVVRILALSLGILLWAVVQLDGQQNKNVPTVTDTSTSTEIENVSIETVGLNEDKYLLVSIEPLDVRLRIRGSSTALKRISSSNAKIQLDLSNVRSGNQVIRLTHTGFPAGLDVEIIPSSVIVTIEEKVKREMPVMPTVTGAPAQGYVAGTPIVQPNRVFVTVPESQADRVQSIRAELDITNESQSVSKQVKLTAYDMNGTPIEVEMEPSVVDIEVPITLPSKTMPLQVQLIGSPAEGFSLGRVQQTPLQVTVFAQQSVLEQLEFYDGLRVDVNGLNAEKTIMLEIPLRDEISKVEPAKVEIKLHVVPAARKTFDQLDVVITGLNGPLEARFVEPLTGTIDVVAEGAPDVISALKPEDIDVMVDLTNLPAGQHQVPVIYSTPSFVRIVQSESRTVIIELIEAAE